jgi:hypothetical protein
MMPKFARIPTKHISLLWQVSLMLQAALLLQASLMLQAALLLLASEIFENLCIFSFTDMSQCSPKIERKKIRILCLLPEKA